MSKNNYETWYSRDDKEVYKPYLVEATPVDWVEVERAVEFDSLEEYDDETTDMECEMQEWFSSVYEAKRYIEDHFEAKEFAKAYIYSDIKDEGIFGPVYNEDWLDEMKERLS